jgi:hypothetical protein
VLASIVYAISPNFFAVPATFDKIYTFNKF